MDPYAWLKVFHVIFVVIWVGGDFSALVLAWRAEIRRDGTAFFALLPDILFGAKFVATPASIGALACGLAMVVLRWRFDELWVLIGLAGLATAVIGGVAILRPRTLQLIAIGPPAGGGLPPEARRVQAVARFEHLVMFLVIADMILKPEFADTATWGVLLAVFLVGAALTLGRLPFVPAIAETPSA